MAISAKNHEFTLKEIQGLRLYIIIMKVGGTKIVKWLKFFSILFKIV